MCIFNLCIRILLKKNLLFLLMLFSKFFNWMRYKNTSTSFLFKNRFFIERSLKFKNIYSNFGVIFKNSKWTSYASHNIDYSFINLIKSLLLLSIVAVFLILNFKYFSLYNDNQIVNTLSLIFWYSLDVIDYYFSISFWLVNIILTLIVKNITIYFFNYNFNKELPLYLKFNTNYLKKLVSYNFKETNNLIVDAYQLKWFYYLFYKNNTQTWDWYKITFINKSALTQYTNSLCRAYLNLYTVAIYLNFTSKSVTNLFLNKLPSTYNLYVLLYLTNQPTTSIYTYNTTLYNTLYNYSDLIFFTKPTLNNLIINNWSSTFFFYKYDSMFKALKLQKWLYKFSILSANHTKINIKYFDLINTLNKACNIDTKLNIWNNIAHSGSKILFNFNYNNVQNKLSLTQPFKSINFYTQSFFFINKRFFFFNSLNTNAITNVIPFFYNIFYNVNYKQTQWPQPISDLYALNNNKLSIANINYLETHKANTHLFLSYKNFFTDTNIYILTLLLTPNETFLYNPVYYNFRQPIWGNVSINSTVLEAFFLSKAALNSFKSDLNLYYKL